MTLLQRPLIWLAGHQPKLIDRDHPEDLSGIAKVGTVVGMAAAIAGGCWATAGHSLAEGASAQTVLTVSVLAGLVGMAIVLLLDRFFIYISDTRKHGPWATGLYLLTRLLVVLISSSLAAQGLMPLLLGRELQAHALTMTEATEQARRARLSAQYQLPAKAAASTTATSALQQATAAQRETPPPLQHQEDEVRRCRNQLAQASSVAPARVDDLRAWRVGIGRMANECRRLTREAQAARSAHLAQAERRVALALKQQLQASQDLQAAQGEVSRRVASAKIVEEAAFTPASATVLADLLAYDPAARLKWFLLSALLMILETMPLWLKALAGRSGPGERMLAERELRRQQTEARKQQAELDFDIAQQVNDAARAATLQTLQSPSMQAAFRAAFQQQLSALAPLEAASVFMTELARKQDDVNEFVRRHPRHASVVTEAWAAALRSSVDAVRAASAPAPDTAGA